MIISQQKVELVTTMGDDLMVVNVARVSFDKFHEVFEEGKDDKLISYLAKHQHWSPFAHPQAQFRIKAPIFVARQLVKHQIGLTWNEVSRRYVDSEPEFYFPTTWRARAESVKQGSGEDLEDSKSLDIYPRQAMEHCMVAYKILIDSNVAPEQARMVLPQNMMTEWIWTGSLAAWSRVCNLRLDPHAQKETQEVAGKISAEMGLRFPVSWRALTHE